METELIPPSADAPTDSADIDFESGPVLAADDTPPEQAGIDTAEYLALADELNRLGRAGEAEPFYRAAIAQDPDRSDSWSNLGLAVIKAGRPEEAILCEREALRLDPTNAEAMNNLGIAMHALNALPEAENHFRGVLRLVPDHANATLNVGVVRQSLGHLEEAERCYRRARAMGADEAQVCNNLALVLAEMDRLAEAEIACRDALAARPDYPEATVNLGMILLMRGRMREAWPHYEARWNVPPLRDQAQLPDEKRWTGAEPIEGKTLLLLGEQGFGDVVQFCRYAPMAARRGARVILAVPSQLNRLMLSLRGVSRVVSQDDPLPDFDLFCPMMSLPMVFGTDTGNIPWRVPYLEAEAEEIARWQDILPPADGLRAGLVWAGASRTGQPHAAAIDRRRSMPLWAMAPLAEVVGCRFVSLQLGDPAMQAAAAPFPLLDLTEGLTDFASTAGLIENLDLVIAVDTAVAHVAGALGKPVWLLNRFDSCWRWPRDRDDSAWYPTMRLFRQTTPGDWDEVMRRVAEALPGFQVIG